jgi:hypothetical protein
MTNIQEEQKKTIEQEILPLQQRTASLVVKSHEERASLSQDVRNAEDLMRRIEERFHPTANKESAHSAYKAALDTEKAFYGPITAFIESAKRAGRKWDTDEAIRVENERKIADAKRRDAENKKSNDLIEKAADAEKEGKPEVAEALLEQAATPPMPAFTPPPVAVKKLIWKARVLNVQALCRAIAAGTVPFSVVEIRQSQLNDFAKGYDGQTKIDGLQFYKESVGRI